MTRSGGLFTEPDNTDRTGLKQDFGLLSFSQLFTEPDNDSPELAGLNRSGPSGGENIFGKTIFRVRNKMFIVSNATIPSQNFVSTITAPFI